VAAPIPMVVTSMTPQSKRKSKMFPNERRFRLPGGGLTSSSREYHDAWHKIADPIAEATGSRVHGYDPRVSFLTNDRAEQHWELPVNIAQKLSDLLTKKT
jgi:hypothetical protein